MDVTLPTSMVINQMKLKLNQIELSIQDNNNEMDAIVAAYEDELRKYNSLPLFLKLFRKPPADPRMSPFSLYTLYKRFVNGEQELYDRIKDTISVVECVDKVTLDDAEIAYYGISFNS